MNSSTQRASSKTEPPDNKSNQYTLPTEQAGEDMTSESQARCDTSPLNPFFRDQQGDNKSDGDTTPENQGNGDPPTCDQADGDPRPNNKIVEDLHHANPSVGDPQFENQLTGHRQTENKDSGELQRENKVTDNLQRANQVAGDPQGETQVTGDLQGENQNAGDLQGENQVAAGLQGKIKFAGDLQGENQDAEDLKGEIQVAGDLHGDNQVAGDLQGENQVDGDLQGENQVAGELQAENQFARYLQGENQFARYLQGENQFAGDLKPEDQAVGDTQIENQAFLELQPENQVAGDVKPEYQAAGVTQLESQAVLDPQPDHQFAGDLQHANQVAGNLKLEDQDVRDTQTENQIVRYLNPRNQACLNTSAANRPASETMTEKLAPAEPSPNNYTSLKASPAYQATGHPPPENPAVGNPPPESQDGVDSSGENRPALGTSLEKPAVGDSPVENQATMNKSPASVADEDNPPEDKAGVNSSAASQPALGTSPEKPTEGDSPLENQAALNTSSANLTVEDMDNSPLNMATSVEPGLEQVVLMNSIVQGVSEHSIAIGTASGMLCSGASNKPKDWTSQFQEPTIILDTNMTITDIAEKMRLWIEIKRTSENLDRMLNSMYTNITPELVQQELRKRSAVGKGKVVRTADIEKIHLQIMGFNADIRNIFDNYVCFHGKRDEGQFQKQFNSAYQRAQHSWENSGLRSSGFRMSILTAARNRLLHLYQEHNKGIIENERDLIRKVTKQIGQDYEKNLKRHVDTKSGQHTKLYFEAIDKRMKTHCLSVMRTTMSYGGRLNDVVLEATENMQKSLQSIYKLQTMSVTFRPEPASWQQRQNALEKYKKAMTLNSNKSSSELKKIHDQLVHKVTDEMDHRSKEYIALLLDAYFLNWMEHQLEIEGRAKERYRTCQMGLYLTYSWVSVVAYTPKLDVVSIGFPGCRKATSGFPAKVARLNGDYRWGYGAEKMISKNEDQLDFCGSLYQAFLDKGDVPVTMAMLTNLIAGTKTCVEGNVEETMNRSLLVIPSWFCFTQRHLLRECFKGAGFQHVVMLTESSLAAFWIFNSYSFRESKSDSLVLVLTASIDDIIAEIFGFLSGHGSINGAQLLAAASSKFSSSDCGDRECYGRPHVNFLETVKSTYQRTVEQLNESRRKNVRHYTIILDVIDLSSELDDYFEQVQKMKKVTGINMDNFFEIFAEFSTDSGKLEGFMEGLIIPVSDAFDVRRGHEKYSGVSVENIDEVAQQRKKDLLSKCARMEEKLKNGEVSVGKLTKKIILGSIEQGRLAAGENMVWGSEAKDIDELFVAHNFGK